MYFKGSVLRHLANGFIDGEPHQGSGMDSRINPAHSAAMSPATVAAYQ